MVTVMGTEKKLYWWHI